MLSNLWRLLVSRCCNTMPADSWATTVFVQPVACEGCGLIAVRAALALASGWAAVGVSGVSCCGCLGTWLYCFIIACMFRIDCGACLWLPLRLHVLPGSLLLSLPLDVCPQVGSGRRSRVHISGPAGCCLLWIPQWQLLCQDRVQGSLVWHERHRGHWRCVCQCMWRCGRIFACVDVRWMAVLGSQALCVYTGV